MDHDQVKNFIKRHKQITNLDFKTIHLIIIIFFILSIYIYMYIYIYIYIYDIKLPNSVVESGYALIYKWQNLTRPGTLISTIDLFQRHGLSQVQACGFIVSGWCTMIWLPLMKGCDRGVLRESYYTQEWCVLWKLPTIPLLTLTNPWIFLGRRLWSGYPYKGKILCDTIPQMEHNQNPTRCSSLPPGCSSGCTILGVELWAEDAVRIDRQEWKGFLLQLWKY